MMKAPTKAELYEENNRLWDEVTKLQNELNASKQAKWLGKIQTAYDLFYEQIPCKNPRNVYFEHVDESGYHFIFEIDSSGAPRQHYAVTHADVKARCEAPASSKVTWVLCFDNSTFDIYICTIDDLLENDDGELEYSELSEKYLGYKIIISHSREKLVEIAKDIIEGWEAWKETAALKMNAAERCASDFEKRY